MIEYTMRISRLTVDKLGVKLYDKVSAVIAELISNAYDADATEVTIDAPMGEFLASKAGGKISDKGFTLSIKDNGHGMTPEEMQNFFLVVGAERRTDPKRGDVSRKFKRKVMGRKGVGKLAPFGICRIIEIISSGGDEIHENGKTGFLTSHIKIDYDEITSDQDNYDTPYKPHKGEKDNTLSPQRGTEVILSSFNYRRVSDISTLSRQIAQRFGIESDDWSITLRDNMKSPGETAYSRIISEFDVTYMPNTKIEFKNSRAIDPEGKTISDIKAGFTHDDKFYPLEGWIAYSKYPYKDDLMAGIRIYCRGKIAAQTSIFNRKAGFTGEHNIRSYLIGEITADWLDREEDLIQTDRRDILWSDELGSMFQQWGQNVVQRVGTMSRDPMRTTAAEIFKETGRVVERAERAYPHKSERSIKKRVIDLATLFGKTINRSDASDTAVVNDLVDLSIELAPHVMLDEMMREAAEQQETPLRVLSSLLRTAKLAELASFGRIAHDRIKVMERLERLKDNESTGEDSLQKLIEDAPWLMNPEWAPITMNQTLNTLRNEFEKFFTKKTGIAITLTDFDSPNKRPDFVLTTQEGIVQIIEIKKPSHKLTNKEMDRIIVYHNEMDNFLKDPANKEISKTIQNFHITLVCDDLSLTVAQKAAFDGYCERGIMTHINWRSFLAKSKELHKDFLAEAERQKAYIENQSPEL